MNQPLEYLFRLQAVIIEMQSRLIESRSPTVLRWMEELCDVYKVAHEYYYGAEFYSQKTAHLQTGLIESAERIKELEKEVDKLLKTLEWKATPTAS